MLQRIRENVSPFPDTDARGMRDNKRSNSENDRPWWNERNREIQPDAMDEEVQSGRNETRNIKWRDDEDKTETG